MAGEGLEDEKTDLEQSVGTKCYKDEELYV